MYWFDKALEKGSDDDKFYYWKTRMQKMKLRSFLGNSENIIKEQKQIVSDNTEDVNERCLLIAAYIFADDYETAYKEFLSAITQFPNEWQLYIHGGDICKKLKKYDEAFNYWNKAEEIGTTFLDGKYSMAFCYEELGKYKEAHNLWNEIADELKTNGFEVESKSAKTRRKLF